MIGKIIKGNSFSRCVGYVLKKEGAEIINANIWGDDANEYAKELEFSVNPRPNRKNKVVHIILSLPIQEKLDDETWMNILDQYLEKMEFTNNHYMAVKHSDRDHEHAHIITNQIRLDGSVVSYDWERIRSQEVIRGIEKDFGLTPVKSSWETDRSIKTTRQLVYQTKTDTTLIKTQIADKIDAALLKSANMTELTAELKANNVEVHIKKNPSGEEIGISYRLDNVSLAGSKIGRTYSLSQISKKLGNISPLEPSSTIAITEIPAIIRANVQPNMTMPDLLDRLKESGVEAYVTYTRTKKVKGISFSVGNQRIAGNELGKEFSFTGLQKYLDVSFDPGRDNSQLIRRSPPPLPEAAIKPESELISDQVNMVKNTSIEIFNENQVDGKYQGNYYDLEAKDNKFSVIRKEDRQVVLRTNYKGEVEIDNLTPLDIERFAETTRLKGVYDKAERDRIAKENQRQQEKQSGFER
jgi:hypothetical protein